MTRSLFRSGQFYAG